MTCAFDAADVGVLFFCEQLFLFYLKADRKLTNIHEYKINYT